MSDLEREVGRNDSVHWFFTGSRQAMKADVGL